MLLSKWQLPQFWILDFRLGRNLKKTKPWVQLANSQSKIQNPKSKIGTARNLGIDLARLGRQRLTAVAFAKRVPCKELGKPPLSAESHSL